MSRRAFGKALKKLSADIAAYSNTRLRELAVIPADREAMATVLKDLEHALATAARHQLRGPTISAGHHQAERLRKALAEVAP